MKLLSLLVAATPTPSPKLCSASGTTNTCNLPQVALNSNTLTTVVGNVFLGIGVLAVIFLIIGGVRYAISGGDAKNVKEAKETILYAIIGLVIALLAFTLVTAAGNVAGGGHL